VTYHCEVKDVAPQPTLGIRRTISIENISTMLGEAYGAVAQYLGELGEYPAGPPYAAYYNDDMQNLDIEAGFPVARELEGRDQIEAGTIPGGEAATCMHIGPYDEIEAAYAALTEWIEDQGREPTGICYEMYLNDPDEVPPEELQTQILFPLKS